MNFKEMKWWLAGYPSLRGRIKGIESEVTDAKAYIKARREDVPTVIITDMPRGSSMRDTTGDAAAEIIEYQNGRLKQLYKAHTDLLRKRDRIDDMMRELTPDEYDVIKARYVDGIRWDFVPGRVNRSRRHCFDAHNRAIKKMVTQFESGN